MQIIGNQNSLRTWVGPAEDVRALTLEIQPISSVYVHHTLFELNNKIRVYGPDV